MDKCRDTVLITGLKGDLSGADFIKTFSAFGEIKTHSETAQRLAEMKIVGDRSEKEGIVTYVDQESVEKAKRKLHGKTIDGRYMNVKTANSYFHGRMPNDFKVPTDYENLAWRIWREEGIHKSGGSRGGKGGRANSVFSHIPGLSWLFGKPGNDGEPGKPGPGGEGGKGGKPAHGK